MSHFGSKETTRYPRTGRSYMEKSLAKGLLPINIINCKNNCFYLPVHRIENLYYDKNPFITFCGKFYFYEPDSTLFLNLGNTRFFGSKWHALLFIDPDEAM